MGNRVLYPDAETLNEQETRAASAYHFFWRGGLSIPDPITSDTVIPTTGDGYEFEILPATVIPLTFKSVLPSVPFVTVWEGSLELTVDAGGRVLFLMKTSHTIGSKTFTHARRHIQTFRNGQEQTLPLVVFNSLSFVNEGQSYTFGDDTLSFDADDLRVAPTIGYTLELQLLNTGNNNRKAGNIASATFQNLDTISYQLRHMGPL